MGNIDSISNEFGKPTSVGDIDKTNISNDIELNKLLSIIIYEYAHKIRSIKNDYGEMLEEYFATIFLELCINNAKNNEALFETLDSVNYQKYESQIRALLYI